MSRLRMREAGDGRLTELGGETNGLRIFVGKVRETGAVLGPGGMVDAAHGCSSACGGYVKRGR